VGRWTEVCLFFGIDIAGCVFVELEEGQCLVYFWIEYSCLCNGKVGRGTEVGFVCGLDTVLCVVLKYKEIKGLV
jgi:hypothetical protein